VPARSPAPAARTPQRRAIRAALEGAERPLSPAEIHATASRAVPGLGIATVYRALRDEMAEGWLVAVPLPGEASRYEVAGKEHHHHFHCRVCDRVYEIAGCPAEIRRLLPRGFRLESHELTFGGRCPSCAAG